MFITVKNKKLATSCKNSLYRPGTSPKGFRRLKLPEFLDMKVTR